MSLSGIILGVINIAIVIAVLLLVGALIEWMLNWIAGIVIPPNVRNAFLALVALIALYMMVALMFGIPTLKIIGAR